MFQDKQHLSLLLLRGNIEGIHSLLTTGPKLSGASLLSAPITTSFSSPCLWVMVFPKTSSLQHHPNLQEENYYLQCLLSLSSFQVTSTQRIPVEGLVPCESQL